MGKSKKKQNPGLQWDRGGLSLRPGEAEPEEQVLVHETRSSWGTAEHSIPRAELRALTGTGAAALTLCQRLHLNARVVAPIVWRGRCSDLENIEGTRLQVIDCHSCGCGFHS